MKVIRLRSLYMVCQRRLYKFRGLALSVWIRACGGTVGPGLMVDKGVHLRHPPGKGWAIGADVYLGRGTILDVWPGATLEIGEGSKLMHSVVVAVRESVKIGRRVQIADCSTVRDANHGIEPGIDILSAPMTSSPVHIGDGAWLAWGTATLSGANVGSGAVIGAGSVVLGFVPDDAIAVGIPAKVKRQR